MPDAPIGYIFDFPRGAPIPDGWLECDGAEYDPDRYPKLYKVLRLTYGNRLPAPPGAFDRWIIKADGP